MEGNYWIIITLYEGNYLEVCLNPIYMLHNHFK